MCGAPRWSLTMRRRLMTLGAVAAGILVSLQPLQSQQDELRARAHRLHHEALVLDTHAAVHREGHAAGAHHVTRHGRPRLRSQRRRRAPGRLAQPTGGIKRFLLARGIFRSVMPTATGICRGCVRVGFVCLRDCLRVSTGWDQILSQPLAVVIVEALAQSCAPPGRTLPRPSETHPLALWP